MKSLPAAPDPLFLAFQLALAGRYSIDRELTWEKISSVSL